MPRPQAGQASPPCIQERWRWPRPRGLRRPSPLADTSGLGRFLPLVTPSMTAEPHGLPRAQTQGKLPQSAGLLQAPSPAKARPR